MPVKLLPVAIQEPKQSRDWTNDALNLIQLVSVLLTYFWHLCPMGERSQVVFLVVTVIEGHDVIELAVVTHGIGIPIRGRRTVVFVVVVYVDERQREEERRQVAQ